MICSHLDLKYGVLAVTRGLSHVWEYLIFCVHKELVGYLYVWPQFFEENGGDIIPYLAWVVVPPSVSVICFCIGDHLHVVLDMVLSLFFGNSYST